MIPFGHPPASRVAGRFLISVLTALLVPVAAAAQGTPASAPGGSGPMVVERIKTGFLAAPDFKVTDFDDRTSELAGAYAGWLTDQRFLVGGGGYWLASGSQNRELAYGGLVVGWLARPDRRLGFGIKGLVGAGESTLATTVTPVDNHDPRELSLRRPEIPRTIRFRQNFFVGEPEADAMLRLSDHLRLTGGIGYRLIGGARGLDDRLQGVTGSVALQIGGGF